MGCGASNVTVVINLDRPNSFFFAGEIVSGTAQLNVKAEKLEADEIDFMLIGDIGYTTRRSNGRTTTTEHHNISFLAKKYVFARPEAGEKELTYSQGQYSWPFQFQLPDQLPPTMGHSTTYPHVRYYLQLLIDKPWYKHNTRANRYIRVYPHVNLLQKPNCMMPTMFGNQNRKDIIVKGTLNKLGYVPGEMIQGTIEIENPQQVLIKQIDFSMIENYRIGANAGHVTVIHCIIPEIMQRKDQQIVQTFGVMFPALARPPSYHFEGGIIHKTSMAISYILKFEVKVGGMFTDFEIIVPIIVGTEPKPNQPG
jgi:hypothetical protein